jgi:PAS domain-containing protein
MYGLLIVSAWVDFAIDEEELALFQEVAGDIAFALHNLEQEQERKQARLRLLASETRYRLLMDSANDAIFIADAESGMLTDANHKAQELIGRSLEEIQQMHQSELHPPEESEH